MSNFPLAVPAELLGDIKEGLIEVGYAHEHTPLSFIQECYISYVLVRQTQLRNTNIPYALCLLPKDLRDIMGVTGCEGGGGTDPVEVATPVIVSVTVQGTMLIIKAKVTYTDPLARPASLNARAFNDNLGYNSFSDTISDPVSGTEYELIVSNVTAGEISVYANAGSADGESSKQSETEVATVVDVTPVAFDLLNVTSTGFSVSPIPKGGAYWSTSTGQTGTINYTDGSGSGTFSPALSTNTWFNIETTDGTRKQQVQWLPEIQFDSIDYNNTTGALVAHAVSNRNVSSQGTAKYTIGGTEHTVNLTPSGDNKQLTGTLSPLPPNDTVITIEDPVGRMKTLYTVFGA